MSEPGHAVRRHRFRSAASPGGCALAAAGFDLPVRSGARDVRDARNLREAINAITRAALAGTDPPSGALGELNRWGEQPVIAPQLDRDLGRHWTSGRPVRGALALIAREAIELVAGPDRQPTAIPRSWGSHTALEGQRFGLTGTWTSLAAVERVGADE